MGRKSAVLTRTERIPPPELLREYSEPADELDAPEPELELELEVQDAAGETLEGVTQISLEALPVPFGPAAKKLLCRIVNFADENISHRTSLLTKIS